MSKKLVTIENNQPVTTSLKVAEVFDKNHRDVLRDIRNLISQTEGMRKIGQTPMFQESTYIHEQNGQSYPMYFMNRDGFTLLAMGFTGKKAIQFKIKYIEAFNRMEKKLDELAKQGKDQRWLETRQHGIISRKQETGAIKQLIDWARSQGCTWKDYEFYATITVWCNEGAGLPRRNGRDNASVHQLNIIDLLEGTMIRNVIIDGIADGVHWLRIWAQIQQKIRDFLALLGDKNSLPVITEVAVIN